MNDPVKFFNQQEDLSRRKGRSHFDSTIVATSAISRLRFVRLVEG